MRTTAKLLGLGLLLALSAACAGGTGDLLLLRTSSSVAVMDANKGMVLFTAAGAVPSMDWRHVLRAEHNGAWTVLSELDPTRGGVTASRTIEGILDIAAVSRDGQRVALVAPGPKGSLYPAGRATTRIVLDSPAGIRSIDLRGNFRPEAFSYDASSLFVIEYLPALHPDRYRVRRLDLASDHVVDVRSVDKTLQQAMRGTARTQAMAPNGRRLYTMYTLAGDDGATARSFVHMLSLDGLWAHCIDLPLALGTGPEPSIALAVSTDSKRLYVADTFAGLVAEIDTGTRRIVRTAGISLPPENVAHAAATAGKVYLARGARLLTLDRRTLRPVAREDLDGAVSGLQPAADGTMLYAALGDRVAMLDGETGRLLRTLWAPGVDGISGMGRTTAPIDDGRAVLNCAC
jgi:hypothetical protein